MEKFERLFRLYKMNYYIVDLVDKKIVQSEESCIYFRTMFFKDKKCPQIEDIEYLLSNVYKHIKNYQKNKIK
jgi:hypothetical protein